ncbi:MAG: FkbM family methyltransferase [Spirochaetes bacterium]|nr:FkbM family methyltransferase [Spirochaetota bacterium]
MKKIKFKNSNLIYYTDKISVYLSYDETYRKNKFIRNGIKINDNNLIFDVGAGLGLFSKKISSEYNNLKIFAFEPVPEIYNLLQKNLEHCNAEIHSYNFGISDTVSEKILNFYPEFSVKSGIVYGDSGNNHTLDYKKSICVMYPSASIIPSPFRKILIKRILKKLETAEKIKCRFITLSTVIKENNIQQIDLLKLSAENHEIEILNGIEKNDWVKIRQISMAIYDRIDDRTNTLQSIINLLKINGFHVQIGEHDSCADMGIYMLYAKNTVI